MVKSRRVKKRTIRVKNEKDLMDLNKEKMILQIVILIML